LLNIHIEIFVQHSIFPENSTKVYHIANGMSTHEM
jgi:hypothetical protein